MTLPFAGGEPQPVVIVGENGSGKTNFLSIVVDALFEAAAKYYTDIASNSTGLHRPWFRVLGPATISAGAQGACALLEFEEKGPYFYREKVGELVAAEVAERVPATMKTVAVWGEGATKEFLAPEDACRLIYERGVHLYFPSSRSEMPHWLNKDSLPSELFNVGPRFVKQLHKPIYIERGIAQLKQWLLALLVDVRVDFRLALLPTGQNVPVVMGDTALALRQKAVWDAINSILRLVLGNTSARLVWMGGAGTAELGFTTTDKPGLPLEALSAGQATLLNVFGTLVRYAQGTTEPPTTPEKIRGICVVDEIDAHLHVDLQYRALPALLRLFPHVQFLLSSHSPLFVLGLEREFGDGAAVMEMPGGVPIQPEAYAEFARAFELLRNTRTFNDAVLAAATESTDKLLVLLEGETDPLYMKAAAVRLGRDTVSERVEFEWVGNKDPKTGQGFHTGKDALNAVHKLLLAKPDLVQRNILLLYDNDAQKADADFGKLRIRSLPTNPANRIVTAGIENLLPPDLLTEEMFDTTESRKPNGTTSIVRTLNKMRLCRVVCERRDATGDFIHFESVLDAIERSVTPE